MTVKAQRKANAAPVSYKVKPARKARTSTSKTTSKSNGKHLRTAYEHLHIGIVESSLDGKYTDVNEEFCRILGYSKEELLKLGVSDCTHEDDYALDIKLHQQLVDGKIPFYGLEKRFVRKDGQIVWVELTRSLVRDTRGNPVCTMGVVIDISEYKHVERVLRESAENLRLATEAARMFKWELNFQRQLYTFADNFTQVLGFSAGLLPQNSVETVWRLSPEEDVQAISKAIARAVKNHRDLNSLQYRMVDPESGQTIWLEANAKIVYDDKGNPQRMFGVAQNITASKKAQEEIRILSKLPAENPNPVMRLTPDGKVLYANHPSQDLLEAWKQQADQTIPNELKKHVAEAFASGLKKEIEITQNGKTFSCTLAPIRDAGYVNLYGNDITERKQIAQDLARERELLARLFETMPVMVSMYDPETDALRLNAEFEQRIGWKTEEVSVLSLLESIYPDPDYRLQIIQRMAAAGRNEWVDVQIKTRAGHTLDSMWSNVSILNGRQIAMGVDITERKSMENALRESEERFRALFNQATTGIAQSDIDSRLIFVNPKLCEMLGYSESELIGKTLWELTDDRDLEKNKRLFERMIARGESYQFEKRFLRRDGSTLWTSVSVSAIHDQAGHPTGGVGVVVDINERKRAEQALAEFARQQAALYQLSDRLHHTNSLEDVYNAALNAILSALQCDRASILLFDDTGVMRFVAWRGLSDGYRQATEGHSPWGPDEKNPYPICIGDIPACDLSDSLKATIQEEGIASLAFIPLVLNGKLIGKFMVYFNAYHECNDNEIELGLMIGRQLASGIERKQVEETLRIRARQQEAVARLGELAVRERELQKVFDHAARTITETLKIEYCKILELMEDKKSLLLRAGIGWKTGLVGSATVGAGLDSQAGYTLLSNTPVVVVDFREERRFNGTPLFIDHSVVSGMSCIVHGADGNPWGVIGAHATRRTNFTQDDVNFLTAVANILSDAIQRQQADQALHQSEERYRTIVDTANEGIWYVDLNATTLYLNEPMARILGYSADELIGRKVPEFCFDEDVSKVRTRIASNYQGNYENFDFRFRRKDGSEVLVLASTSPARDGAGKIIGALGMFVDVTARKRGEERLRESEERLRVTFDTAVVGFATLMPDSRFVEVNDAFCKIVGYTREELLEMDCAALTHPLYVESTYEHITQLVEGKIPSFVLEKIYVRKDGAEIWVQNSVSVVRRADGTPLHLIAITQDITERKQAEEQLQKSAEFDAFRVALVDALRPLHDPEKILGEAMRVLGEKLQVDRVLYSEIEEDDETILILDNYVKEGVPKLTGLASLNDYGKARDSLNTGQNLIIVDATTSPDMDEKDRAAFAALGIRSGLGIPLIKNERWVATLGIHHGSVRTWTENEIKFVEETAERTWSALERARAQEKLRASETLYRTIARSIPGGGVYVVDKDFRYLVAEGPVTEAFGLLRESIEGRTVWEAFPGERGERMSERLLQTFAGETVNFETEYQGHVYWTRQAPLQDSIGQAIIVTTDITERKRAEEALRQSEERFARFMQNLPGLAWIKDVQGHYVYANAAAENAFSTPRERLYGRTDLEIFPPNVAEQFRKNDEQALVNEKGVQTIEALPQSDGVVHYSLVNKFPIPGTDGNVAWIGGTAFDITERLQAEEALRKSEERYRGLFNLVPIAVYTCDADGLIREYNQRAAELWGREPRINDPQEKYCGAFRLYYPDGGLMLHEQTPMSRALAGEVLDRSDTEIIIERPDGSRRNVIAHPLPLRDENGRIVEAINCLYDMTDHKRIEEALRIENERFMRFIDSNIVGILIGDASGKVTLANDYYLHLLGVSRQDFIEGKVDWKKFTPPEWMPADEKAIEQLRERGVCEPYEKEYIRTDGTRVPIYIADAMLPGPSQEIAAFVLDITERRHAEEALHESQERLSAILRQATAGIVRKDAQGRFVFVNEAFCNMLGYSEAELLGKTVWEFMHEEDIPENKRSFDRLMMQSLPFKLERRFLRKDGSLIWVDASVAPVLDADGKSQSAVAVEVDITARKQAEEALQQLNQQLESRVQKRTATIQAINQSLREEIAERKRVEEALRMSEAAARASEEKLRTLFDLLPVGISFLDPKGKVIQSNSALSNILKLSKEQLFHETYTSRKYIRAEGTPMPVTEFAGARALAEAKTVYNVETGVVLENGEVVWTSVSAAPVDVEEVGVVVVTVDITDSKRAERALQESHMRLRVLSQRLVEVQEEERRALARELHDRVGQTLAALNINLIIINSQLSADLARQIGARLNDSMKLVGETIALVRDVMTDLRPAVLDDYGLEAALESHINGYRSRYNLKVTFEKPGQPIPRLGPSIEMTFLRIAQEALMNIAKHAHAEHVNLLLRQEDESLCLTIQDDGIGIESWQDANRPGSHGLNIMRERAEAFGGTLKVKSVPNQGTIVDVSIPYKKDGQNKAQKEKQL